MCIGLEGGDRGEGESEAVSSPGGVEVAAGVLCGFSSNCSCSAPSLPEHPGQL